MSQRILPLNFNFDTTAKEYENPASPLAYQFANVPGCRWKIRLLNGEGMEAEGTYLFESQQALDNFKQSALFEAAFNHPASSNSSAKELAYRKSQV